MVVIPRSIPRRLARIGSIVLIAAAGSAGADVLPEFQLRRTFDPVRGNFNSGEATSVRLSMGVEGYLDRIPISWRLLREGTVADSGDTLVPAAKRSRETVFVLPIPALEPGSYILEVTTDPGNEIEEKDERNNTSPYAFAIPNGRAIRFRCEGPEGSTWELYRVELNTSTGEPYPSSFGTKADTTRSTQHEVVVNGIEPGDYSGIFFGPPVNRVPVLLSNGDFEMSDPPAESEVIWPRMTPYVVGRPKVTGDSREGIGGETGAPRWGANDRVSLEGSIRNPTDRATDCQWLLRFLDGAGASVAERDTLFYLGALSTEKVFLSGRVPRDPGNYLLQAEVRVPWPAGFEDLGEGDRAASFVLPLGWIEIER
jgi:hypothetical protein